MKISDFIAFDVETATGDPASICQIGYVKVKNLEINESNSFLIQPPGNEFRALNSNIHGISALDTANSPTFPKVWKKIRKEFKRNILIAHNASFDANALVSALELYDLEVPKLNILCTYELTSLKLKSLCQSLNVCIDNHHDALCDATACANCFIKILNGIEPNQSLIIEEEKSNPFQPRGHEKLQGDILKPNLNIENKDNPFFSKKVVLTGVFESMTRQEAANIIKNLGADIDTGVTKRTNYLLAGSGAGPSKLKKVDEYNKNGAEIVIIREEEFIQMIN